MLTALPPELIAKVFQCLLDSPRDYKNLSRTCTKLCGIASRFTERTALKFIFNLDLGNCSEIPCESHGQCPDLVSNYEAGCELQLAPYSCHMDMHSPFGENLDASLCCYYHRIYCMLHAKHTTFSAMKFVSSNLLHPGCMMAFETSPEPHKLYAIVELELFGCFMTLEWLATMLKHLRNLDYLIVKSTQIRDRSETGSHVDIIPDNRDKKVLKALRILSVAHEVSDSEFKFFIENCPAIELDLTVNVIEDCPLIMRRFYGNNQSDVDVWTKPSKYILTFKMVYLYLSRHKNVLRSFRLDETIFAGRKMLEILANMPDLHLTCRAMHVRSKKDLDEFKNNISPRDLERVDLKFKHLI